MSIRKPDLLMPLMTALTAFLVSTPSMAQMPAAAPAIEKPVAPTVAPVAMPAPTIVPQTENTSMTKITPPASEQAQAASFKPLTPMEQTHIAIAHERAARQRYYHDTHNLNDLTPQQRADMKQELAAWFTALPLSRQVDLKRRDEILFGNQEYRQKQRQQDKETQKPHMPVVQIVSTPDSSAPVKTVIKTATPQALPPARTAPAAPTAPPATIGKTPAPQPAATPPKTPAPPAGTP